MSAIRDVIVFLENNPKSDFSSITEGTGLSNGAVSSQLDYLKQLGQLTKTGTSKRWRYSVPAKKQYAKTKPPARNSSRKIPVPAVVDVKAKKQKIIELIEKGLYLRAQTAISHLIADAGDQDTVNWALDKNAACGAKAKYL